MIHFVSYKGPFTAVATRVKAESKPPAGFGVKPHPEDPFFWISENDKAISYHIVLHNVWFLHSKLCFLYFK